MDVADLDGDKGPELLYVARSQGAGGETFNLRALEAADVGQPSPRSLGKGRGGRR